jgi:hypothetical protein
MTAASAETKEPTQQDVCIDLPGESVQCWRSSDNIKIILRKHRDVVFDLNLGKGKTYTVHSTTSDFYNARDRKLVYAKRGGMVTFRDGERLHLWVTRTFEGELILKSDGKILMKIAPNELDKHQYDDAPKTKPAPIVVALGPSKATNPRPPVPTNKPSLSQVAMPAPSAAPLDEECSIVCVVDGTVKDMPAQVAEHFKKGGGQSGIADIDPNHIATRNWIWGQLSGAGAYVIDNWSWLRASLDSKTHTGFRLVTAKVHLVRGKVRFYFSGFSKYNTVFGPGGFGPAHDRVMNIFAGAGKTSSAFAAVAKGVGGTFKGNALLSFIFGAATAIAEWKDDIQKDGYDLAASIILVVVKAIISATLIVALVAAFVFGVMLASAHIVPVILIGIVTISAGFGVNYITEYTDKKLGKAISGKVDNEDGLAPVLAPVLRDAGNGIQQSWHELMRKFPRDYQEVTF